jgi:nucleotide-binding universal stress UspA family protein
MFNTVVVASDGSANADLAVRVAGSLVQSGGRLIILHVTELVGGKGGVYPALADEDEIRAKLEKQAADLGAGAVSVDVSMVPVRLGGPAAVIAAEVERVNADLVVTGSRGHSPLTHLIVGSVPVRLLHLVHCPVLVVPATAD